MFRALRFFLSNGWKYDRLYVIEKILYQLTSSLLPIVLTVMPKFIIDELTGAGRAELLVLYVALLAGFALFLNAASAFLYKDAFTHRLRVNAAFDLDVHRMLADADYQNLEDPAFLELQKRAEKFLSCDWHGFAGLVRGKTAVFISHRLSSARFCDRIAVFKGGRIAELGPHAALHAAGGLYRTLYDMQAQFYAEPIDREANE